MMLACGHQLLLLYMVLSQIFCYLTITDIGISLIKNRPNITQIDAEVITATAVIRRTENSRRPKSRSIHLHGKERFLSPEIAPPHVTKSQPPRLQPTPDPVLAGFTDVEIYECAYHAERCDDR